MSRTRSTAARTPSASSARITPRLAERPTGFTTAGSPVIANHASVTCSGVGTAENRGCGTPASASARAHRSLVTGGRDRSGWVVREPEPFGGRGRDDQARVVDCHHRVDRRSAVQFEDRGEGIVELLHRHDDRPVAHAAGEGLRLLGPDHHLDAPGGQPPGGSRARGTCRWGAGGARGMVLS